MIRRAPLVVILAFAVGASVLGPVAHAQRAVTAKIVDPSAGATLSGNHEVRATAASAAGLREVKLLIDGTTVVAESFSGYRERADLTFLWETAVELTNSAPARNGTYPIEVRAVATGGAADSQRLEVMVDNAPQVPSGLQAVAQDTAVSLTWAPNAEPDLLGYIVLRDDGGGFVEIARTTETSYTDEPGEGVHAYQVVALRSSPSDPAGRASVPSLPASIEISAAEGERGERGGSGGPFGKHPFGKKHSRSSAAGSGDRTGVGFAGRGITGGPALPGLTGLPDLPGEDTIEWGTYEEELPYDLPSGGVPLSATGVSADAQPFAGVAPDRMKWLVAGGSSLFLALGLSLAARRIGHATPSKPTERPELQPAQP